MATLATPQTKSGLPPSGPNGTKRICGACSAKFYDFHKVPVICPKCSTTVFSGLEATKKAMRATRVGMSKAKDISLDDIDVALDDNESLDEMDMANSIEDLVDFDELDDVDSLEEVGDHHEQPALSKNSDDADDSMFVGDDDDHEEIYM